jgi:hypothetical protein
MAGLFGDLRGGGGPVGLFGRTRDVGEEEQRRLAELAGLAGLAGELGGSPQSQDLLRMPPGEPLTQNLVQPAQLSLPGDAPAGVSGLPFEPPSNGPRFPPALARDPQLLGVPGAAGGSLSRSPIGGLRAEAEGYADQLAQRGTREWGSAVRNFVMQGPASFVCADVRPDLDSPDGEFPTATEEEGRGFGRGPATIEAGALGRAKAEAENLRPAALFWEGEDMPTQFMRPVAFQGGTGGRASNQAIQSKTAYEKASTPDEPWIVQNGRYVPNLNWRNPAPNLEYYAAFGPPAAAAAAASMPGLVTAARLGRELKIGENLRIAPFGNRTPHPQGKWPHYHRRGKGAGQGKRRHRPWEKKSPDTSFWDRF